MRIRFQVAYAASAERVFPYLVDASTWPRWSPPAIERRRIDSGPPRPGSRWASADRVGPMTVRFTDELVELDPDRRVVWRHTAPWNARTVMTCTPSATGTVVTADFTADPTGRLRPLRLIPGRLAIRIWRSDFMRLAAILESEGATSTGLRTTGEPSEG